MKKKIAFIACLLTGITFAQAQEAYTIQGTVNAIPASKTVTVNLYYASPEGKFVRDSCDVVNGHFSFKGDISKPMAAFLAFTDNHENFQQAFPGVRDKSRPPFVQIGLFLEKGAITAVLDHTNQESASITGTMNNNAFDEFRPIISNFKKSEAALLKRSAALGGTQDDSIIKEFAAINASRNKALGNTIKKYPSAIADLELLKRFVNPSESFAEAKLYYSWLSPELQQSKKGQQYLAAIKKASTVEVNAAAPDFSLADTTGKMQTLSTFKGKYVLVDFWASWCVPCRKETPNLIDAYHQYKNKNFEILSISLDGGKSDSRQQWLQAIRQDKMTWPQVSDLKGFDSQVAQIYTITAIPMNFLVDPSGKIVARNLRGEDLKLALGKLL